MANLRIIWGKDKEAKKFLTQVVNKITADSEEEKVDLPTIDFRMQTQRLLVEL